MTVRIACSRPSGLPRLLASLLVCLLFPGMLLASGCAPRMKADVQAVSAPGFRKAGQSYVLAPGAALSTLNAINADMFRQSTQRLRAVLTGHGYREAPNPEAADMAVVVEWKVDGPNEVPDPSYSSRPSVGVGIGYGSRPWYGGAYGSRYGGWGYGGYRGFGTGYGYPPPMTVVYTRTLSVEARDLRSGRAIAPEAPSSVPSGQETPEYARPPYGSPIGTVEGLPPQTELTGPVLWKVVVSSTGSSRDIQGALPALTVAASRWIGITANVKVAVDDEFNVTILGQ
ncbi:hypothetical protein FVW20_06550 [Desulfovibrio oxamicus]|uniref:DUF4136 domain-containing protein n=1 Tax=Nitratidesulfovibrio oxamicus TaxID=32016 RepID=A0ABS0J3C8_9BACT|nr:hypothetical protein [Nitratidesulfovibrio oxamicus]MBG3876695.1 hypothetical protein [Nitratidesulfovibrio oxamicus]